MPKSEFGDWMVKQNLSKEDRAKNPQMPILGNAKIRQGKAKPAQTNGGDSELDW